MLVYIMLLPNIVFFNQISYLSPRSCLDIERSFAFFSIDSFPNVKNLIKLKFFLDLEKFCLRILEYSYQIYIEKREILLPFFSFLNSASSTAGHSSNFIISNRIAIGRKRELYIYHLHLIIRMSWA